jgi:hypothetical protein
MYMDAKYIVFRTVINQTGSCPDNGSSVCIRPYFSSLDPFSNNRFKFSENTYIKTTFQYELKSPEISRAQKKFSFDY